MSPFPFETYVERTAIAQAELARYGLLTMLSLAREPYFYLFGYYGGGYVFCQCAVLTTEGESVTLLCRRPDVVQAEDRSTVDDIRVSLNAEDANPTRLLWGILIAGELTGSTVGVEMESHGYTSATFTAIAATLKGVCKHVDGSKMVQRQRIVKSPEELDYMRKAASLTAAAMTAMLEGDGGMPPAGPLVNSGRRTIYGRVVGGAHPLEVKIR